jgi:hypothetical protein
MADLAVQVFRCAALVLDATRTMSDIQHLSPAPALALTPQGFEGGRSAVYYVRVLGTYVRLAFDVRASRTRPGEPRFAPKPLLCRLYGRQRYALASIGTGVFAVRSSKFPI